MAKLARAIGSTTRNTAEMPPMETGKRRISLAVRLAARVAGSLALARVLDPVAERELERGPAAAELERDLVVVELELVLAAVELELVPVAVELEHGLVVAELELDPAAAAPVQDRRPAQLAVAVRTKSGIAAHHPDQVPLLAVEEDLAAAAETTREPAAAEAATAWAAAE